LCRSGRCKSGFEKQCVRWVGRYDRAIRVCRRARCSSPPCWHFLRSPRRSALLLDPAARSRAHEESRKTRGIRSGLGRLMTSGARWRHSRAAHFRPSTCLLLRGGDLVGMLQPVTLALELAKDNSTFASGSPIELVVLNWLFLLTNDDHLCVEELDQPGKTLRSSGSSDRPLIHDPRYRFGPPDIGEHALRRGSLELPARENAIVHSVSRPNSQTLVPLAGECRSSAGFALRRERIEFLLEPFSRRICGCRCATSAARVSSRHRRPLRLTFCGPRRASEQRWRLSSQLQEERSRPRRVGDLSRDGERSGNSWPCQ